MIFPLTPSRGTTTSARHVRVCPLLNSARGLNRAVMRCVNRTTHKGAVMFRRLSLSVLLIACAATYVIAVERATFILTDGERKSGAVVYHGDQHENLINGFLDLGTDNGTEQTFPLNQVAIIDFVGGQPPVTELAQLGTEHMLVTRDGGTQQGGSST